MAPTAELNNPALSEVGDSITILTSTDPSKSKPLTARSPRRRRLELRRMVMPTVFLLLAAALLGGAVAVAQQSPPTVKPTLAISARAVVEAVIAVRADDGTIIGRQYEVVFYSESGEQVTTTSRVVPGPTATFVKDDIVDVRFDAADPTVVEIETKQPKRPQPIAAGLLAAIVGLGLGAVALVQLHAARQIIDLR